MEFVIIAASVQKLDDGTGDALTLQLGPDLLYLGGDMRHLAGNNTGLFQGRKPYPLEVIDIDEQQGKALIAACREAQLVLDCSAVQRSTSVGLSLLLAFMRDAEAAGKGCQVRSMPYDMQEIAEVYDLDEVLAT